MGIGRFRVGTEEYFELTIRDCNGGKLDYWKVNKKDFPNMVKIVSNKFGINMGKKKSDLDWAFR